MAYPYGFFSSLTIHWVLHTIFPTKRQRGSSPFVLEEHAEMLHGEALSEASMPTKIDDEEKGMKMCTSAAKKS